MLKVLRDNLKYLSWILWVIVILFVLAIFLDFGRVSSGRVSDESTAATVGGDRVSQVDVQREYRALESRYRQIYGDQFSNDLADKLGLPLAALNSAVNKKLLLGEAVRLGLEPSEADLQKAILELPGMKDASGNFVGQEAYENMVRRGYQMMPADFEAMAREQIALERLNQILQGTVYVSDAEIERSYREQVEKAKIRYVLLPRSRFLQGEAIPAPEVAAYFSSHKDEYRLPEQREAAYLLVDEGKLMTQASVADAEVKAYFDAHQDEFKHEAEVKARHILTMVNDQQNEAAARKKIDAAKARIAAGEDFAKVAQELSEDTGSKAQGGDLGWFGKGRMVKEFEEAAFAAQPGQVVGPVRSSFGFHLIKVEGSRPAGVASLEDVKQQIVFRLTGERTKTQAEGKAKQLAERLAKEKPAGPEALDNLARQDATLTYTASTGRFGKEDPVTGLGRAPAFNDAAFALAKGAVSQAIQVPRGWAILYLKDVLPPRIPEQTEVEPRVRLALAREKQGQLALAQLAEAKAKGGTIDQIAKDLGVAAVDSGEFCAAGPITGLGNSPEVAKAALAMAPGQIGGPVLDAQGAILFSVAEKKSFDPIEFATKRDETRDSLSREKLSRLLQSLIEKRRQDVGVNFSRPFLQKMGIDPDQAQPKS